MTELTVEINTKNLERAIRLFPKQLKNELGDGMDHIGRKFLSEFRKTRLQGPPGIMGRPHGIFTHFSRASIVSQAIEGMGMIIFSDSKIAKMQEEGATISSPTGNLAVPLSARSEMFKGGAYPNRLKKQYQDPRTIKNIIEIELNGKKFLAKVKKGLKQILPLFVLKSRVKIRPRLGFYATWDGMQNIRISILNESIQKTLEKV